MGDVIAFPTSPHLNSRKWGKVRIRRGSVGVSPLPHLPTSPFRGSGVGVGTPGNTEVGTFMVGIRDLASPDDRARILAAQQAFEREPTEERWEEFQRALVDADRKTTARRGRA